MKHNYSYAGIAVALEKYECQLMACTRQVDRLQIVEVSIYNTLALNKGLWLRSIAQSQFFEGALDEAEAAFLYHLHEWLNEPEGRVQFKKWKRKSPNSSLDKWLKLGGQIYLRYEFGRYTMEMRSTGSMPSGWKVFQISSNSGFQKLFTCSNECASLELKQFNLRDLEIKVIAG